MIEGEAQCEVHWRDLQKLHKVCATPLANAGVWMATAEHFGRLQSETAETERDAVIAVIHRLKLDGWDRIQDS